MLAGQAGRFWYLPLPLRLGKWDEIDQRYQRVITQRVEVSAQWQSAVRSLLE